MYCIYGKTTFQHAIYLRTVVSIGFGAFENNDIKTVTFPAGYVFYVCTVCMVVCMNIYMYVCRGVGKGCK
jgi:hypothetical protein